MQRRLVRDVIAAALGAPSTGYFCRIHSPLSRLRKVLEFESMLGEHEYKLAVKEAYSSADGRFLTPCELFAPWYSYGIAQWMLGHSDLSQPVTVIEFGGGLGGNAMHILDYIKREAPQIYSTIRYADVDVSAPMLQSARERVRLKHPSVDFAAVTANACGSSWRDALPALDGHRVFVLALELLDNLPHDKVCWSRMEDGSWRPTAQIEVCDTVTEVRAPLSDPWIDLATHITLNRGGPLRDSWLSWVRTSELVQYVPTCALRFLSDLVEHSPNHRLLVADFDALPNHSPFDTQLNAPIVATPHRDLPSYLDATDGSADIFFATDFEWLADAYRSILASRGGHTNDVHTFKSSAFFSPYATPCATRSGYNPLLDDFTNTSVLVRTPHVADA